MLENHTCAYYRGVSWDLLVYDIARWDMFTHLSQWIDEALQYIQSNTQKVFLNCIFPMWLILVFGCIFLCKAMLWSLLHCMFWRWEWTILMFIVWIIAIEVIITVIVLSCSDGSWSTGRIPMGTNDVRCNFAFNVMIKVVKEIKDQVKRWEHQIWEANARQCPSMWTLCQGWCWMKFHPQLFRHSTATLYHQVDNWGRACRQRDGQQWMLHSTVEWCMGGWAVPSKTDVEQWGATGIGVGLHTIARDCTILNLRFWPQRVGCRRRDVMIWLFRFNWACHEQNDVLRTLFQSIDIKRWMEIRWKYTTCDSIVSFSAKHS